MKRIFLLTALWLAVPAFAQTALGSLDMQERSLRQAQDLESVQRYRKGLQDAVRYVQSRPEIFGAAAKKELLPAAEREAVRRLWQRVLDYYLALDSARRYHADFSALADKREQARSFHVSYAAFLAAYSNALPLIEAFQNNGGVSYLLNEAVPELGLPAASYDRFKLRFLNVAKATEFVAMGVAGKNYGGEIGKDDAIRQDVAAVLRAGKGSGQVMTLANGMNVIHKTAQLAVFPAQAGVAEWMGDVKVHRQTRSLISAQQAAALPSQLEPGDILLVRREWYLSNIGLPGFWPHAAIYIGAGPERARYFDDPEVRAWVRAQGEASGDFERLVQMRYPHAREAEIKAQQGHGGVPRVIEAISEGVSFTGIEHAADADSLVALRPRLSKTEKAMALLRAFGYVGRPYDFDFDFRTDSALVCTELVFKSYEAGEGMRGLSFPLVEVMGRVATPANEMARQFDQQYGTSAQQTDFVLFLDGQERRRNAVNASLADFRLSWHRPKWHVLTQDLPSPVGVKKVESLARH